MCLVLAPKSIEMHSYKKRVRNCFGMRTYKIIGLKTLWNVHLRKKGGGSPLEALHNPSSFASLLLRLLYQCSGRISRDGSPARARQAVAGLWVGLAGDRSILAA